uniref:Uncharacterized protein n=1 Tax=Arundo donax TaxID=35708 RepID=A0A0A9ENI9_ARUDO
MSSLVYPDLFDIIYTLYSSAMYRRFWGPALYVTKLSQTMFDKLFFNWCYTNSITYVIIPILSCVATYPSQHTHLHYTQPLDMSPFSWSTFCTIQHRRSNRRPIELAF